MSRGLGVRCAASAAIVLVAATATAAIELDIAAGGADLTIWGDPDESHTGAAVAVGDFNGDGTADLAYVQSGYRLGPVSGRVCILFGPFPYPSERDLRSAPALTCIDSASLGQDSFSIGSVANAGDVDEDGIEDLLVTSKHGSSRGFVAVFRGRSTWAAVLTVTDADWLFIGAELGDSLANALGGNLNGDGHPDLVLFAGDADGPANARDGAGEGYVFFGPVSAWTKRLFDLAVDTPDVTIFGIDGVAENPVPFGGDSLGFHPKSALIANLLGNDGFDDLVVAAFRGAGATNTARIAGEVYVLRGRLAWPTVIDLGLSGAADLIVQGPSENAELAHLAVGDWNADGIPDLLLGGRFYSPTTPARNYSGAIFILLGGSLSGVWDLATRPADGTILGPREYSQLGQDIAFADFDGDGWRDLIAASVDFTPWSRPNAGAVFVLSGCEGFRPFRDLLTEPAHLALYAADSNDVMSLWSTRDLDGDGRADLSCGSDNGASFSNSRNRAGEVRVARGRPFGAAPACSIVPDAGPPITSCGATAVWLDGSATSVTGCTGSPEYRWMQGTTLVRDWLPDPRVQVLPAASTTYRLEVRCGACPLGCFDAIDVTVTVDPDLRPPDLGNTLRAVRAGGDVVLGWGSVAEARTFVLHRGTVKGVWPAPLRTGLAVPAETLPDVPGPPDLYLYRAAGASCSGLEGP